MIIGMEESRLTCEHCNEIIIEYYDENYKGARGKCAHCGVDFPLE